MKASTGATSDGESFLRRLERASVRQRPELLLEFLRGQIAARLDVHPEEVDPRGQLIALGMSSLKAVELKTQLESEFELSLRSSLMFDYPTLELLVPFVLQRLRLAEAPGESPPPREPQRPVAHAERPQDAASALAAELEDLLQEG